MNGTKPERIKIGEGIYLNYSENSKYKTNYISVYFTSDLDEKTASYNALISRVLIRGCGKYPTQKALNRALDHCYGAELNSDVCKTGEWHSLGISLCLLDGAYAMAGEDITSEGIELLREVITNPLCENGGFCAEFVAGEKKNAENDISAEINNKAQYSKKRMISAMCKKESFSVDELGKKSIIRKTDPVSLFRYYEEMLKKARIEIFFVGAKTDTALLEKKFGEFFAGIKRDPAELTEQKIINKVASVKDITETMDITQSNLVIGQRTGISQNSDGLAAMMIYNSILGGSLTSKLFTVVREKMSLCYSIYSQYYSLKGMIVIYAGINADKKGVTVSEIFRQAELIKNGEFTKEEKDSATGALVNALNGLDDNPAVTAEWYLPRILFGSFITPAELKAALLEVTDEDIIKAAKSVKTDTVYFLTGKEICDASDN